MTYISREENLVGKSYIGCYTICTVLLFLLCWLFNIEGNKEYGWFAGFWHGLWVPYNWIRSCIFNDIYIKAPLHTSAYNVIWWIFCCLSVLASINSFFSFIKNLLRGGKK